MASIGHVAVGLAARRWYERDQTPRWAALTSMVVWSGISLLPDIDVFGFRLGVHYEDPWGHRGATHSFVFALMTALVAGATAWAAKLPVRRTTLLVGAVVASHGLLDTLTDGGLGCALLWPFSDERFFAPWTPLPVAPLGRGFISREGLRVALTELAAFAVPFAYGLWPKRRSHRREGPDAV
jgi:inner membrane protein